jgi:hypothetical protein
MPGPFTSPVALSTPFEPNRDPQWGDNPGPSGISSLNVQDAIEEAKADALANDRFVLLTHYGGNAGTGRYLEWYPAESSLTSPVYFSAAARLLNVTCQTTAATATCTIGVFDVNVSTVTPIYSFSMVAQKRVSFVGVPSLASFPANALIAIRVTAGSINTPEMQVTFSSTS